LYGSAYGAPIHLPYNLDFDLGVIRADPFAWLRASIDRSARVSVRVDEFSVKVGRWMNSMSRARKSFQDGWRTMQTRKLAAAVPHFEAAAFS
jgi:hypothetical protein